MKLKENLSNSSSDFWYDLTEGGYLDPFDMCENVDDAQKVADAIEVLMEFQQSCEDQIDGFVL